MKVRVIDRILVLVYGLIGLFMAVAAAIGFDWLSIVMNFANGLMAPVFVKASIYAVMAFFALYSIYIIWFALHRTADKEHYVSISNAENGSTRVSVGALSQLVEHSTDSVSGISDVKTCVRDENDAVKVSIDMNVTDAVNIPEVTMRIKDAVRNRMESVSGIGVRDIDITVGRILPSAEGRIVRSVIAPVSNNDPVNVRDAETPGVSDVPPVAADVWMPVEQDAEETAPETEEPVEAE